MQKILNYATALGLSAACAVASAQSAGTWMGKVGFNHLTPHIESGDFTGVPGGKIDAGNGKHILFSLAYMVTDNVSAEFLFGTPPHHNLYGDGTLSPAGKLGSTRFLPPALAIQYRFFDAKSALRPYVGAAVVYAKFRSEKTTPVVTALTNPGGPTTSLSIDSAWGSALMLGATYAISERWFIDASVVPMFIKTTARLSTGQTVDAKLDPIAVNASIGYRF